MGERVRQYENSGEEADRQADQLVGGRWGKGSPDRKFGIELSCIVKIGCRGEEVLRLRVGRQVD